MSPSNNKKNSCQECPFLVRFRCTTGRVTHLSKPITPTARKNSINILCAKHLHRDRLDRFMAKGQYEEENHQQRQNKLLPFTLPLQTLFWNPSAIIPKNSRTVRTVFVGRSVTDHKDFDLDTFLTENRIDCRQNRFLLITGSDHYADRRRRR
jgi:hypothetical protein